MGTYSQGVLQGPDGQCVGFVVQGCPLYEEEHYHFLNPDYPLCEIGHTYVCEFQVMGIRVDVVEIPEWALIPLPEEIAGHLWVKPESLPVPEPERDQNEPQETLPFSPGAWLGNVLGIILDKIL